jgi:hypothetical protein
MAAFLKGVHKKLIAATGRKPELPSYSKFSTKSTATEIFRVRSRGYRIH